MVKYLATKLIQTEGVLMFRSIQQFEEKGINNLQKVEKDFIKTKDMAGLVTGISGELMKLGTEIIAETLEYYDEVIRKRPERKSSGLWYAGI